jgi:tetratricopeptide (TPR) repeat protein
MRVKVGRVACAAACLIWLAGCETTSTPDPFSKLASSFPSLSSAKPSSGDKAADNDTTGSIDAPPAEKSTGLFSSLATPPELTPELLGTDPNDDLAIGKKYFRQGSYGLAERHFRKAVELHPRDAESWVGLAAAYDRLRRFDLADRAYAQAIKLIGETPEIMNNQGFSYMLRSDYRRARAILLAAKAKAPDNPHIAANLQMLGQAERKAKGIN